MTHFTMYYKMAITEKHASRPTLTKITVFFVTVCYVGNRLQMHTVKCLFKYEKMYNLKINLCTAFYKMV